MSSVGCEAAVARSSVAHQQPISRSAPARLHQCPPTQQEAGRAGRAMREALDPAAERDKEPEAPLSPGCLLRATHPGTAPAPAGPMRREQHHASSTQLHELPAAAAGQERQAAAARAPGQPAHGYGCTKCCMATHSPVQTWACCWHPCPLL